MDVDVDVDVVTSLAHIQTDRNCSRAFELRNEWTRDEKGQFVFMYVLEVKDGENEQIPKGDNPQSRVSNTRLIRYTSPPNARPV